MHMVWLKWCLSNTEPSLLYKAASTEFDVTFNKSLYELWDKNKNSKKG